MEPKKGALSVLDLRDAWKGALDKSYRDPLLQAGDGFGLEPHSLLWEIFARISEGVDITTQAMFISPGSGQTNPSAQGGAKAVVELSFMRSKRMDVPIYLEAGTTVVVEETEDASDIGGVTVRTGRKYVLLESVLFAPGKVGPFTVLAEAEKVGYGYNNPRPGSLRAVQEFGAGFQNNNAFTTGMEPTQPNLLKSGKLTTENQADMFVPEQIGQYIELIGAAPNGGQITRIINYIGPDPTAPRGAIVTLEQLNTITATVFVGTFVVGGVVTFFVTGTATGVVVGVDVTGGVLTLTVAALSGNFDVIAPGTPITGPTGVTATVDQHLAKQVLTNATGLSWRVLDWAIDLGVTVTNPLSPTGGRAAFLDELGFERGIARAPGELDDTYMQRIREPADTISPNAIKRALVRTLGAIPWCFREVGTDLLPGFFYDSPDAYDSYGLLFSGVLVGTFIENEPTVVEDGGIQYWTGFYGNTVGPDHWFAIENGHPASSYVGLTMRGLFSGAVLTISAKVATPAGDMTFWHLVLSLAEFRGFFLVCLPKITAGEFGFPYDDTGLLIGNAYDALLNNFYDGFAALALPFYQRVYQTLDTTRAAGVGFDLCIDNGCV